MRIVDYCAKNSEEAQDKCKQFHRIFNTSLARYWDNLTRFDTIKFDEEFIKSGDKNMGLVILEKYGQEAVDLIQSLC